MSATLIYLHGFRSGPQSAKVQALAARMRAHDLGDRLWCEQLSPVPFEAVAQATAQIEACLKQGQQPALAGSSLGGFYATWLANRYGLKAVLINPFVPHADFDNSLFLGAHAPIYGGPAFDFTAAHVQQIVALDTPTLRQPDDIWLLAEAGDETLDVRQAVARYASCRQTVLPGGNHSFTRWADYLDAVLRFTGLLA